jgi:hypothetical protein
VMIKEEILERKVAAPIYKTEINGPGEPSRWPRDIPLSANVCTEILWPAAVLSRPNSLAD